MKITIKNQEYKLLHNIPKGTRLMYNDEECVKTEKSNMLVGIETGRTYMLPPTKKIYMNTKRQTFSIESLSIGDFFIYEKELYVLLENENLGHVYRSKGFNFKEQDIIPIYGKVEVELVQDKNIQIKVK